MASSHDEPGGETSIFLWFSYGFPITFPFSPRLPMGSPWPPHTLPTVAPGGFRPGQALCGRPLQRGAHGGDVRRGARGGAGQEAARAIGLCPGARNGGFPWGKAWGKMVKPLGVWKQMRWINNLFSEDSWKSGKILEMTRKNHC